MEWAGEGAGGSTVLDSYINATSEQMLHMQVR